MSLICLYLSEKKNTSPIFLLKYFDEVFQAWVCLLSSNV